MEFFKIKGFENYSVNNIGQIKNNSTGKILKCYNHPRGYLAVGLSKNKKSYKKLVHRIVAENFLDIDTSRIEVNHIDGNKHNNNLDNLEWCNRSENLKHAYDTGLKIPSVEKWLSSSLMSRKLLNDLQIKEVKKLRKSGMIQREIAKKLNVSRGVIRYALKHY